jgi:hypothetical protein
MVLAGFLASWLPGTTIGDLEMSAHGGKMAAKRIAAALVSRGSTIPPGCSGYCNEDAIGALERQRHSKIHFPATGSKSIDDLPAW